MRTRSSRSSSTTEPDIYRLAAAIVGPDEARDVAQESFVAAWRDLPKLRQLDRFEVWLRRIVINRSRNALRSRGRRPNPVALEGMAVAQTASPGPGLPRRRFTHEMRWTARSRD